MIKRFCYYYRNHKLIFTLDLIASFLVAIIGMGYPIISRTMLNDWIPDKKMNLVIIGGSILLAIYLIRTGLRYFITYYGHVMGTKMQAEMRIDMFNKLQKLPYKYFDNHETGEIMSRLSNDLMDISELAHHGPENIFVAGFTLLGAFVYLLTINWVLGLIVFVTLPLCFVVSIKFRLNSRKAMRESKVAIGKINAQAESSISGIRVTKAFTNSEKEEEKFEEKNKEFVVARSNVFKSMGAFLSINQFIQDLFNVVILIAGGIFLYNGSIDFGDYSAFVVSVALFTAPLNQILNFTEQFQSGAAGFRRFIEVMDQEEEKEPIDAKVLLNAKGKIKFENVSFTYSKTHVDILSNVSFEVSPGKTIALVGPSGGGKTTICHLIPKFYQLEEGVISIDDIPINELSLSSLRSNIGIVQQDVFLFSGTIRDNILYGKLDATEEEINDAIKKANLLDFIKTLPNGLDTNIGERGVKLSGGQKQRISIARVFLKNPSILILDEATSALDNTTEMLIQESLNELAKGRTVIVVAHRLSTIKNADEIIVVSKGTIKEKGNHEELINIENGMYKSLYELQFRIDDDSKINIPSMC